MFKSIRKWLFYKAFTKRDKKRIAPGSAVNPVRNVCILFDGTDENQRKIVHQFKKTIAVEGRSEVKSLAFVNNRLPLDNVDYAAYNLKHVNWYGIPSGEKVEAFIKFNYDMMIVLCKKMLPHYEYIIAHSEARFFVGPAITRAEQYFDLIVDLPKSGDTNELIKNVIKMVNLVAVK
jgi:hypothetical protein